jgi:hypothetical protein
MGNTFDQSTYTGAQMIFATSMMAHMNDDEIEHYASAGLIAGVPPIVVQVYRRRMLDLDYELRMINADLYEEEKKCAALQDELDALKDATHVKETYGRR